jgi:hypothetical protein
MCKIPGEYEFRGVLVLYKNLLAPVCGNMGALQGVRETAKDSKKVGTFKSSGCMKSIFMPPEFIAGESMGTALPRRCPVYKNCKECKF